MTGYAYEPNGCMMTTGMEISLGIMAFCHLSHLPWLSYDQHVAYLHTCMISTSFFLYHVMITICYLNSFRDDEWCEYGEKILEKKPEYPMNYFLHLHDRTFDLKIMYSR